jgi:four helix bundle protein
MKDFSNLEFWKRAHSLVILIYKISHNFPKEEIYGLTSQIRRSAVSVPSNIAEGCGRNSSAQQINFFQIACGSLSEFQYQTLLAFELGYLKEHEYEYFDAEIIAVRKMIYKYIEKLSP